MKKQNYGVIVAGGKGSRMGGRQKKQYLPLHGKPIIVHTLSVFDTIESLDALVIVAAPEEYEYLKEDIIKRYGIQKRTLFAPAGEERQESVYSGLKKLPQEANIVVIHDAVRPFVTREMILGSIEGAEKYGAAVVGVPVKDTIRRVDAELFSLGTPERSGLWLVQTPQAFDYRLIMEAHQAAVRDGYLGTDDGVLVERLNRPVKMIEGSYRNIKITTPEDLMIGEQFLIRGIAEDESGNRL